MKGWLARRAAGAGGMVPVTRKRRNIALAVAMLADAAQLALIPLFSEGALSPFDDALDAVVALALLFVLGFRWPLLLALGAELVPGVDLLPTWTAVVLALPIEKTPPALPRRPAGPA